jgi:zinc protease
MKAIGLCALSLGGVLLLASAALAVSSEGKVQEYFLDNGMQVLIKEVHTTPVVTVQLFVKVGARWEYPGISGISHWVEHMCYRGTEDYTYQQMNTLLSSVGADVNGYTDNDMTCYHQTLPNQYLELALKIEASRLARCTFDPQLAEKERTVVISELEGDENRPEDLLYKELLSQAFTIHPYQFPTIGFRDELVKMTRDDLYKHYKEYYIPNNAILVVVGDVDGASTLELIKKYFAEIPSGPEPRQVNTVEPPQNGERRFVINGQGNTSYLLMAFHQPSFSDPDIYTMYVIDSLLGGGTGREKGSRLKLALVESGLCSSLSTYIEVCRDPNLFFIQATPNQGVSLQQVEDTICGELKRLADEPIDKKELEKAKNQVMASFAYQNESISGQAQILGRYACMGDWRATESFFDNVKKVTVEQVMTVAKQVLSRDNMTVGWYVPEGGTESTETGALDQPLSDPLSPNAFNSASWQGYKNSVIPSSVHNESSNPQETSLLSSNTTSSFNFERKVLSNGLTVIVKENHSVPLVTIAGLVKAGSIYESAQKSGLANLTAQMLSLGNAKMDKLTRFDALEFVGANLDYSGGMEVASISGKCMSKDFGELEKVLFADLTSPSFSQEEFDLQKTRTLSQIDDFYNDPYYVAYYRADELLYGKDNPLGRDPQGSKESVSALSLADVQQFYADNYGPERTIIVIVGDVSASKVFSAFEQGLGKWQGAANKEVTLSPPPTLSSPQTETVTMPGKAQTDVAFAFLGPTRTAEDYYAARLLAEVFGGLGFGGRINDKVREEMGLAYYAFCRFQGGLFGGPWAVHMGVNTANVQKAVQVFLGELDRIVAQEVTDDELTKAKGSLIGEVIVRMEAGAGVAAVLLGMEYNHLGDDYVARFPQIINAVTKEDLLAAAKHYLTVNSYTMVVAGP